MVMPLVLAIIPKINGIPSNQVIYATTNPSTLGQTYSQECIGISIIKSSKKPGVIQLLTKKKLVS